MGIDDKIVAEIVKRILSVTTPNRIILFGSAAMGGMTAESDIDLLILDDSPADPREASIRVRNTLRGIEYPFDIIVMATARFDETRNVIGGLAYPADKYGKVIYAHT